MSISFDVTEEDADTIRHIADMAVTEAKRIGIRYTVMEATMDLTACHANGCKLQLMNLLAAAVMCPGSFNHDVFGIRGHLDRSTGKLRDCFLPRFAE